MNRREWLKSGVLAAGAPLLTGALIAAESTPAEGGKPELTLWQLPNQTKMQMESFILLTRDDKLIVIDGGPEGDMDYLIQQIKSIHPDGRVDYWLFTHIHLDHASGLAHILKEHPDELKIGTVYCDFPTAEWVKGAEAGSYEISVEILKYFAKLPNCGKLPKNQPLKVGNVEITALNELNDLDLDQPGLTVNDTSIVYRVKTPETTLLFLGDLYIHGQKRIVENQPAEAFKADVVQMAHHGQNGVTKDFYELVRPSACLWCAPAWLWNNNIGPCDGSGPWKTIQTRAWMDDLGVKKHYVLKDGLVKLEFN